MRRRRSTLRDGTAHPRRHTIGESGRARRVSQSRHEADTIRLLDTITIDSGGGQGYLRRDTAEKDEASPSIAGFASGARRNPPTDYVANVSL